MSKGRMLSLVESTGVHETRDIAGPSSWPTGMFSSLNEPATALNMNTGQRGWGNRVGGPLARSVRPTSRADVGTQKHRRGCW